MEEVGKGNNAFLVFCGFDMDIDRGKQTIFVHHRSDSDKKTLFVKGGTNPTKFLGSKEVGTLKRLITCVPRGSP